MESPPVTMVEKREKAMVSPTGSKPFQKKAYFLTPTLPSSSNDEPPFKLPHSFSSLPSHFEPTNWPLKVEFFAWRQTHENWKTWVDQMASVHESTWKKAGIYEAIISSTYQIRKQTDLVYGLAEKWCSETNTFIFPWGEATITLEDVMVLGGYSVLGDSVLSPLETPEMKEIEERLNEGGKEIYRSGAGKVPIQLWLKKFMNSGNEFEHEAFLAFWLSRYVFPGACNVMHKPVSSIAIHLARGTRIALAAAVLASIYRDLGLLKNRIVYSNQLKLGSDAAALEVIVKSPFQLVQVWAWERFLELGPKPHVIDYGKPRMARWEKVNGRKVENLRVVLDLAGEDFKWRPFAMAIKNWHLPKYYPQKETWVLVGPDLDYELQSFARCLRVGELAGLGTTEHYLPHRVAMQFGYDQDVPYSDNRSDYNSDVAWKNVKLYLPSRLFEGDVSTRYLKWWKQSVSGLKDASEADVSPKRKAKNIDWSLLRANHPPVPPGFSSKCNSIEAGDLMDEDELTISELLKYRKKHENSAIREGGGNEKLSGQVHNLAPPVGGSSVNPMKSSHEEIGMAINECASLLCEKRLLDLKARCERMESVVRELKAHRSGDEF